MKTKGVFKLEKVIINKNILFIISEEMLKTNGSLSYNRE